MTDYPSRAMIPEFGRSVFVCSKPLRVFHAASIVRSYSLQRADLCIYLDKIEDQRDFQEFVAASPYQRIFGRIRWYSSAFEVARDVGNLAFDSLFLEDDRVSFYHLFSPLKPKWLVVFEEGISTYRGPYGLHMSLPRKMKWKAISLFSGCGLDYGYGKKTDFVVTQNPDLYRRLNPKVAHKALPFPGLLAELRKEQETWDQVAINSLAGCEVHPGQVCLILGTWGGSPGLSGKELSQSYDQVFFKSHPHDGSGFIEGSIQVANSWVPAEVLIDYLATRCARLEVLHYSSSAAFYMKDVHPNVLFRDLRRSPQLLEILES